MRQCPNCKTNNPDDARFCNYCGMRLPESKEETLYSDLDELEEAPKTEFSNQEIEEESEKVIDEIKAQKQEEVKYEEEIMETISRPVAVKDNDVDEFLEEAIDFVVSNNQGSASMLQRKFKIGFNRAARLIDSMEERGIVGPSEGSKPRKVLITKEELENLKRES